MFPTASVAQTKPVDNVFATVKAHVTSLQAFAFYVTRDLKRVGGRWVARCPFHEDRRPSLTFFADGGWKCFGCGAGGDAVDLVCRFFHLSPLGAATKLAQDFHLALPTRPWSRAEVRRAVQQREAEQQAVAAFRLRVQTAYDDLATFYRAIRQALLHAENPFTLEAVARELPLVEYQLDELLSGDPERQLTVLEEVEWLWA